MFDRLEEIALAEQEQAGQFAHTINVCMAAGCMSSQSEAIKEALVKEVENHGTEKWCHVRGTGCMGLCAAGPLVAVEPETPGEILYQQVKVDDAAEIVSSLETRPVERLRLPTDVPFFQRQKKIVIEKARPRSASHSRRRRLPRTTNPGMLPVS